ncbi:MAG: cupin domain-containing protein [Alphaproteobacteria bacterium]
MTADDIIATLQLKPHPEGGYYRETWVAEHSPGTRPTGTCIYFLLAEGMRSHWHKVDATEIWHFHSGAELLLTTSPTQHGPVTRHRLGPDLLKGARPQVIVPELVWQSAQSMGPWSLVSCTVSPGFQFEGFTLAPPDFMIMDNM